MAAAGPVHDRRPGDDRAQRQPVGNPLGQAHDIAGDAPVFRSEHLSRSAHPALDLVKDEQDSMLIAELAQTRQEVGGRHNVAALALDRLDEDRRQLIGRADGAEQARTLSRSPYRA